MKIFDSLRSTFPFIACCALALTAFFLAIAAHARGNREPMPLKIEVENSQGAKITQDRDGSYEIKATGTNVGIPPFQTSD